jgi:choline-sulfatase
MPRYLTLAAVLFLIACARTEERPVGKTSAPRPSILLVTLDTTRADAIGRDTPSLEALMARGTTFRNAYATVPQTLPSHASMMTGFYAGGHRVHENGRYVSDTTPLLAERLRERGYHAAAFVSAFALAKRFGLARGFEHYDEPAQSNQAERTARETTDRVLAWLEQQSSEPLFLWVHYYDPHFPYAPPEPFLSRFPKEPYRGEVAFMDEQIGRLVAAFEKRTGGQTPAILVLADHGEGLGEHGEAQHGNLLYQSTMHVPLVIVGPGVARGTSDAAVSTRRVFHTVLDFAGIDETNSLRSTAANEIVLGEAMKPFLDYGWQPQVMAVEGRMKAILAGRAEVYDLDTDPGETQDQARTSDVSRATRAALREYPIPSVALPSASSALDAEAQRKLASLGYVAATVAPVVRPDAPRPADMTALFPLLDEAASLFVREQYAACIPLLETILTKDPHNLEAALRLATAYSSLGRNDQAVTAFERARGISPDSQDVRTYLALHYARTKDWQEAVPLLERVVAESPDRLPAVEALALVRERQNRIREAVALRQRVYAARTPSSTELARLGEMQMAIGDTAGAIASFENAGPGHDLELGVLYLAARSYEKARESLDRVPPAHRGYPMALFKRAQVAVLLHEPDAAARIEAARQRATPETRVLIERELLFRRASR